MSVTSSPPSRADTGHATLSTRAFPRRVRILLEGIFEIVTGEIDRGLIATLDGLEQQLFKLAEQARSNEMQLRCLEALGTVKRGRFDLMPRYIASLESSLAVVRDVQKSGENSADSITFNDLALVAETDMDETTLLHEISSRAEMKASLPLFLLSQRFGVLAGKPALDSDALPIGPATLCRHLRRASHCFELSPEHRQLLFRQFDRHVMTDYVRLIEVVNAYLVNQGVLPNLAYLPARLKHAARREEAKPEEPAAGQAAAQPQRSRVGAAARLGSSPGARRRRIRRPRHDWSPSPAGPAIPSAQRPRRNVAPTTRSTPTCANCSGARLRRRLRPWRRRRHGRRAATASIATDVQSVLGLLQRPAAGHRDGQRPVAARRRSTTSNRTCWLTCARSPATIRRRRWPAKIPTPSTWSACCSTRS